MIEKLISYTAIEHRTLASISHCSYSTFLFFTCILQGICNVIPQGPTHLTV